MEEKNKTFIAFKDDDDKKKELIGIIILEKNNSYLSFEFQRKVFTIPWHRILKLKEAGEIED